MRSSTFNLTMPSYLIIALAALFLAAACGTPANTNTNTNSNTNATANINAAPANANTTNESLAVITAREPDKYRATLTLSAETENGEKTIGMPTLSVALARNGDARRVAFKLPDGSDLIYIDTAEHHYVVLPGRKQYAELTPEAVGFQIQRLMTPGQIVKHLEKLKGVQQAGEETFNGRTAMKYSYSSSVETKTQAGEVKNRGFVYIDKDTGLPLRAELVAQASGDVKGMKSAKIVAEMRDISTDVEPTAFEIPPGLKQIPPEQIRSHIDALTSAATTLVKALLANLNTAPPPPAASPSPSASVNK
jgi:hypothetical protein